VANSKITDNFAQQKSEKTEKAAGGGRGRKPKVQKTA